MIRTSILVRTASIGRRFWAALGLSILCCAAQWPLAAAVTAQNDLCGNRSIDFAEGETCDDGGTCEGGDNDGMKGCSTLDRCEGGVNQGDVCTGDEDCQPTCPSDCDGNGTVDVAELVLTLEIGLGREDVDACPAADPDEDGAVSIDNAVLGVDSALTGCPAPGTCAVSCPGGTCIPQDGDLDLEDSCPANCRINRTCADPTPMDVTIRFTAPGEGALSTGRFFLRYPDEILRLPGSGTSNMVFESFSFPWLGTVTPNDLDYAVRVLATAELFLNIDPDELFTIRFDLCGGAVPPTAEDFRCTVFDAFDPLAQNVTDETTCFVDLP